MCLAVIPATSARADGVDDEQLGIDASQALDRAYDVADFGGMYLAGGLIRVRLVNGSGADEAAIVGSAPSAEFAFETASQTWQSLLDLQAQLWTLSTAAQLGVTATWPDAATNTLHVGVTVVTPATLPTLEQVLGTTALTVATAPSGGEPLTATRSHDSPAWNGGDYIALNATGGTCTSGPPVVGTTTGNSYFVTAAHCFNVGQTVRNYDAFDGSGGNGVMGTVNVGSYTTASSADAEIVLTTNNGGSSALNFTGGGGVNDTAKTAQTGGGDPAQGTQLCADGAFEGLRCYGQVMATQGCYNYADGTRHCGMNLISSGILIAGNGDSGGPVVSGGKGYAYGIVNYGWAGAGTCPADAAGRTCYKEILSASMGYIDRYFGLRVKTS